MELSKEAVSEVKEMMRLFHGEITEAIRIIDSVSVKLEAEKNWAHSTELAKAKQILMDLT